MPAETLSGRRPAQSSAVAVMPGTLMVTVEWSIYKQHGQKHISKEGFKWDWGQAWMGALFFFGFKAGSVPAFHWLSRKLNGRNFL